MYHDVIIAGFGGQGVLLIGNLLAQAGMENGLNVTFIPVYGAEMRGGTANCTVVISDDPIGAPIVARPLSLIAMNGPSLRKFQPMLQVDGMQVVNSSLIESTEVDTSKKSVLIPVNEIADKEIGDPKLANMVALGALLKVTACMTLVQVQQALEATIPIRYHNLLPKNREALAVGYNFVK